MSFVEKVSTMGDSPVFHEHKHACAECVLHGMQLVLGSCCIAACMVHTGIGTHSKHHCPCIQVCVRTSRVTCHMHCVFTLDPVSTVNVTPTYTWEWDCNSNWNWNEIVGV